MRVKYTSRGRRKKIMKLAKGYYASASRRYRIAKEAVMHALRYAWEHRRLRKRQFRALWIMRINAFVRQYGLVYSKFMEGLRKAGVKLDRKMLAELAVKDPQAMLKLIDIAKKNIE